MIRLYLDIDGVLLTTKHTQAAPGVEAFVDFITSQFECYWLTTHCKGNSATAIAYLTQFLPPAAVVKLQKTVQPTTWDTLKTEAIDMQADFYWLEDSPMQAELARLRASNVEHRLLLVDLKQPDELLRVQAQLAHLLEN